MSSIKKMSLLIMFLFTAFVSAQNMQEGFTYLEQGKFAQAETFFEKIAKEYPNNKTARLCYGRAIGLNGKPEAATAIFTQLLQEYPGDFELELNYAESLLWNKRFTEARAYYSNLAASHPESFPALLGFANTLSNLKEYPLALDYVNRALQVQPGNANALVSRKYIRLGYAAQLSQNENYTDALALLDENLADFTNDRDTQLNKANIYLIIKDAQKAHDTYAQMATTQKDSVTALMGFSLGEHIRLKDKKALDYAKQAVEKANATADVQLVKQANERYIQALVWNHKYAPARHAIEKERETYGNEPRVLALSATLGMYTGDYNQSTADYQNILAVDSLSFDGNLGVANAYYANGHPGLAYSAAQKTLSIFENQKDAQSFIQKLHTAYSPYVEERVGYSFDNGKNRAYFSNTSVLLPVSYKWAFSLQYQYRHTENTVTNREATLNDFKAGAQYQFHPKASFNVALGTTSVNSYANGYSQFLGEAFFKVKPFALNDLEVGYRRDVQNFNADLANSEITADNLYLNYNMGTNFNLGWFTQYYYTSQSDGNHRNLLFTSLYYSFLSQPVLKGGLNYQYISFEERRPEVYFSPARFNLVEVFADFLKDEQVTEAKSLYYGLTAAGGYQFIENNDKQATYRFQGKFGYKFSDRFLANAYFIHSNIASATAAGFTYNEIGIRLKWYITSKPLFKP